MTVIVAAVTKDGVALAADSQITAGWEKSFHSAPKLWVADRYAFGAAGNMRTNQVLKHHVTWPKYRPDEEPDFEAFLVKTVVPAIRTGTQGHGVLKTSNGVEALESSLLLATGDRFAEVGGNGCVTIAAAGRAAIGSGYSEALGRLGDEGPWTEDDVIDAVRRATRSAMGCSGPISVVNTTNLTVRTVEQ